ncbi:MAG: HIT family protein [Acidobacteriota bacterium]|nr:HIT family protein [Acidobacteriota bacterium]
MNRCIFCQIIENELPSHKIWENENFLAFLTLGSLNRGHTLLVPKKHINYIFDLEEPLYTDIFQTAKQLSKPLKKATTAKRIGIIIEGFTVPHVHIHLVPLYNEDEIDPRRMKKMTDIELAAAAEKIIKQIKSADESIF